MLVHPSVLFALARQRHADRVATAERRRLANGRDSRGGARAPRGEAAKSRTEIELNAALPWSLTIVGGLCDSTLELDGLELTGLTLQGRAGDLRVVLPRPRGRLRVRFEGGACRVTLLRPAGVAATLDLGDGASRLAFDGERYGAIGGETRLETANAAATDRYEIAISGGASRLTLAETDGGGEPARAFQEVER